MTDPFFTMAKKFTSLNWALSNLSSKADEAWPEGGMIWSASYHHGAAHTIKIDDNYVARTKEPYNEADLLKYKFIWSKLIWRADGNNETLMNTTGDTEWQVEEDRLIADRNEEAYELISVFQTSGASRVHMSFNDDELSLSITCVSLFGTNALVHDIFWSCD